VWTWNAVPSCKPLVPGTSQDVSDEALMHDDGEFGAGSEDVSPLPPLVIPDSYWSRYYPTFDLILARAEPTKAIGIEVLASSKQHPGNTAGFVITPKLAFLPRARREHLFRDLTGIVR
jgi:hypothetical protein